VNSRQVGWFAEVWVETKGPKQCQHCSQASKASKQVQGRNGGNKHTCSVALPSFSRAASASRSFCSRSLYQDKLACGEGNWAGHWESHVGR